jgi:hypothetical protein
MTAHNVLNQKWRKIMKSLKNNAEYVPCACGCESGSCNCAEGCICNECKCNGEAPVAR